MTLRTRLVLALVALTLIGLSVAGFVTYRQQQRFLLQRVDQQLSDIAAPMRDSLESDSLRAPPGATHGTYGELRNSAGTRINEEGVVEPGKQPLVPPQLPNELVAHGTRFFNAHAHLERAQQVDRERNRFHNERSAAFPGIYHTAGPSGCQPSRRFAGEKLSAWIRFSSPSGYAI